MSILKYGFLKAKISGSNGGGEVSQTVGPMLRRRWTQLLRILLLVLWGGLINDISFSILIEEGRGAIGL